MPALGFGVFQMPDADQCRQAVESELSAGYRLYHRTAHSNGRGICNLIKTELLWKNDIWAKAVLKFLP